MTLLQIEKDIGAPSCTTQWWATTSKRHLLDGPFGDFSSFQTSVFMHAILHTARTFANGREQ